MALAAWRREAHPWRLTALFFLLAGGLGGLVLALGLALSLIHIYMWRQREKCLLLMQKAAGSNAYFRQSDISIQFSAPCPKSQ